MRYILSSVILLFTLQSYAQKITQRLDNSLTQTASLSRYTATLEKINGKWYREVFYYPESKIYVKGWYSDKECSIEDGEILRYYVNGQLSSKYTSINDKKEGLFLTYHDNGRTKDSAFLVNGHWKGITLTWDVDGKLIDSSNFDGNGNGGAVHWYDDGTIYSSGQWKNDTTKINRWTFYHRNGKIMATEDYEGGKKTSCNCYTDQGQELDKKLCEEKEANFKNESGEGAWMTFIMKNLNGNVPVKKKAPEGMYTVLIQFVVDKTGNIVDIKPLTKLGYGMEQEVVRVLKKSPDWIPARQYGRTVNAYRIQPVTFQVVKE